MRRNIVGFLTILVTVFLMLVLSKSAKAQSTPFELTWRSGDVVLTSGDSIQGVVTLTHPTDVIRVAQSSGHVSTFPAVNVASFNVSSPDQVPYYTRRSQASAVLDVRRNYVQLMWNHDKDYSTFKSPAFFNVLETGKYALIRREVLERTYDSSMGMYGNASRYMTETIVDKFYLLAPEGKIIPLRNPKKDLPAVFSKNAKQITAFAKENSLSFSEPVELVQIIRYINTLQ